MIHYLPTLDLRIPQAYYSFIMSKTLTKKIFADKPKTISKNSFSRKSNAILESNITTI